ncbi:hypothetical protein [Micromonospora siamensis]|uniref:hypothetical protein n=1 Tax=Micromonospora siamensis TaxID=299152 RepID=UPI000B5B0B38|nr:hypothetical protein [Micromonospora siamensis]
MESYTYERPAAPLAAVAPLSAVRVALAARPWAPQAHQVQVQAELNRTLVPTAGFNGTSGSTGKGIDVATKRMDVRGVPPRGRPV